MRIGFIVGRTEEEYKDVNNLAKVTPKKYLVDGKYLMVDVAIAMIAKLTYPNITIDIIMGTTRNNSSKITKKLLQIFQLDMM